jgi:hypothetical protein
MGCDETIEKGMPDGVPFCFWRRTGRRHGAESVTVLRGLWRFIPGLACEEATEGLG